MNDVIAYIFSLLKPIPSYFLISKQIYELRHLYIILHLNRLNINVPKYRDPTMTCLLYYSKNLKDYKKYILEFKSHKKRKVTYIQAKNSYCRMLIHQFCDAQGLLHETIDAGVKGKHICPECQSDQIMINNDDYSYNFYCHACQYHMYLTNYPETKKLFTHKKVKITKP